MAQHDYVIDNSTGLTVRTDINGAFSAVVSQNSGPVEPATKFPYMLWLDTSTTPAVLKQRKGDNSAWETPASGAGAVQKVGDTMTGALTIAPASGGATLTLNKPAAGTGGNNIVGQVAASSRWQMQLGNANAETGANAGTDFAVLRFSDTGVNIDAPFTIRRSDAQAMLLGNLTMAKATPSLVLDKAAAGQTAGIYGYKSGLARWGVEFGNGTAEGGANAGSNFTIGRYADNGVVIDAPFSILRSNGLSTFGGDVYVVKANPSLVLNKAAAGQASSIASQKGGLPRWLMELGDALAESGGNAGSDFKLSSYTDAGAYYATPLSIARVTGTVTIAGYLYLGSAINRFGYDGNLVISTQGYKPGGGTWVDSSDARIKTVAGDYPRGLDEVCALRPVHYTYKGNDTFEPPAHAPPPPVDPLAPLDVNPPPPPPPPTVPYPNSGHYQAAVDGRQFAGLVAQEVEVVFPEMVIKKNGFIDGAAVTDLRDLDTTALIFALINSVKTLKARVEALEAAAAAP